MLYCVYIYYYNTIEGSVELRQVLNKHVLMDYTVSSKEPHGTDLLWINPIDDGIGVLGEGGREYEHLVVPTHFQ
jgi:hypothetical protein